MLQAIRQRDLSRVVSQIKLRPVRRLGKAQVKLSGCRPKQPCCLEPFFRNAISRDKSVHEPIVRRPAHPLRFVRKFVVRWIAAKPQAQLASAPEGSVILSLSLGGVS